MRTGPPFLTGAAQPAGTDHLSHLYKEPGPIGGHDVNEVFVANAIYAHLQGSEFPQGYA